MLIHKYIHCNILIQMRNAVTIIILNFFHFLFSQIKGFNVNQHKSINYFNRSLKRYLSMIFFFLSFAKYGGIHIKAC